MVQFGGWSVTHVPYLPLHMSFSADGLHVDGLLHLALLGLPDPALTQLCCSYLSLSADGPRGP